MMVCVISAYLFLIFINTFPFNLRNDNHALAPRQSSRVIIMLFSIAPRVHHRLLGNILFYIYFLQYNTFSKDYDVVDSTNLVAKGFS